MDPKRRPPQPGLPFGRSAGLLVVLIAIVGAFGALVARDLAVPLDEPLPIQQPRVASPTGVAPTGVAPAGQPTLAAVPSGTVVPFEPLPRGVLYGVGYDGGASDSARPDGFAALDLLTGAFLGRLPLTGGQVAAWALAPDGRRAYLVGDDGGGSGWHLTELETPSLRVLRRTPLPNALRVLGTARTVVVAPDGRWVYAETLESRAHPGEYARSGDDAVIGIAVYDVAQGGIVGTFRLWSGRSGICDDLIALPDERLLMSCGSSLVLVDARRGALINRLSTDFGRVAVSPDGRLGWIIERDGWLSEIDLARWRVTRRVKLDLAAEPRLPAIAADGLGAQMPDTPGAERPPTAPYRVPRHTPGLSADGQLLFFLAAPAELVTSHGSSTRLWVVETATFHVATIIALADPAADLAPTADGQFVLVNLMRESIDRGVRLLDVATGRERARWAGPTVALAVRS